MNIRAIAGVIVYLLSGQPIKNDINADVDRYLKWSVNAPASPTRRLALCLLKKKEFRSVFAYRIRHHKILSQIINIFTPSIKTIEIGNGGIGPGLYISHYHCVVFCKEAGKNLRIGPGVVVGRNGIDFPVIGNNVFIAANSTVIGNIKIGDNVIVGAGSVVTSDLPSNGIYFGNPAKLYKPLLPDSKYIEQIM